MIEHHRISKNLSGFKSLIGLDLRLIETDFSNENHGETHSSIAPQSMNGAIPLEAGQAATMML